MAQRELAMAQPNSLGFCERRAKILGRLVDTYLTIRDEDVDGLLNEFYGYEISTADAKKISPVRGVDVSDLVTYVNNFCDQATRQKFLRGMRTYDCDDQNYLQEVRECAGVTYVGTDLDDLFDAAIIDGVIQLDGIKSDSMQNDIRGLEFLLPQDVATKRIKRMPILYFGDEARKYS